jgi:hypothetical protein
MNTIDLNKELFPKQKKALAYLLDNTTQEVLYGGGIRSGKSWLAAVYIHLMAMNYAGIKILLARKEFARLQESTLKTLFLTAEKYGIRDQFKVFDRNKLLYSNGSEVVCRGLDIKNEGDIATLGSSEFTLAVLDEAQEMTELTLQTVSGRLSYRLDDFGLTPKILCVCNPHRGWLYNRYYEPWKHGTLEQGYKFVQALPQDNPELSESYKKTLTKKKLGDFMYNVNVLGQWEYASSNTSLFPLVESNALFRNISTEQSRKYITVDVAAGKNLDESVIMVWIGLQVVSIHNDKESDENELASIIQGISEAQDIPLSNVIVDCTGNLGLGVVRALKQEPLEFFSNGKVVGGANIINLRSQCYFLLSDYVRDGRIGISLSDAQKPLQGRIVKQLHAHSQYHAMMETKMRVVPKDQVKQQCGESPDFADCLMMRMQGELVNNDIQIFTI